jgi:hypothetical protein
MFQEFLIFLANFFIIDPFQGEMSEHLAAANVPQEIVQQVTDCAASAPDVLAEKFSSDMMGSVFTIVQIMIGTTSVEAVLAAEVPLCAQALSTAKPFLEAEST